MVLSASCNWPNNPGRHQQRDHADGGGDETGGGFARAVNHHLKGLLAVLADQAAKFGQNAMAHVSFVKNRAATAMAMIRSGASAKMV